MDANNFDSLKFYEIKVLKLREVERDLRAAAVALESAMADEELAPCGDKEELLALHEQLNACSGTAAALLAATRAMVDMQARYGAEK